MRRMTEAAVVENLLSQYPILEMGDDLPKNALIATLLNGEKRLIEFEKTIVPAEVVGRYIVVEHTFPTPGIPFAKHYVEPIGEYENYLEAHKEFYLKAEKAFQSYKDEDNVKEILLVGEFKNQQLKFDYKGAPDVNTGFVIGCTLTKDIPELWKTYVPKEPGDPNAPVTLNTKLYVELDRQTAKLKFEQSVLLGNELNVDFWKIGPGKDISNKKKSSGIDEEPLVKKRKGPRMDTERWVNEPLITKKPGGKGQGKGI